MISAVLNLLLRPFRKAPAPRLNSFMAKVSGVVHVGANVGQERDRYRGRGLKVLWVEPIPEVFARLAENVRGYDGQVAVQALVTDVDDKEYAFHIASNEGVSSSILELAQHKDIWPEIDFTSTIRLTSVTLATLFAREGLNPRDYQALILDTQGSELLVLRGSVPLLPHFTYIKVEASDFEVYKGCCTVADIDAFMREHGFREIARATFATRAAGGSCFDLVYQRIAAAQA